VKTTATAPKEKFVKMVNVRPLVAMVTKIQVKIAMMAIQMMATVAARNA
jgi:hypothetical protein